MNKRTYGRETLGLTRQEAIGNILNESGAKVGVEIGVFKGEFSKELLDRWNGTLYMVDPWRELTDEEYLDSSNHKNHSTAYHETMESIKGFEQRAIMIRSLSSQAADLFEDNSLDFVYIDGNHSYASVKEDLELWWPKLKTGGLMSGHDFLIVDWPRLPKLPNGKDIYVYSSGGPYVLRGKLDPSIDIPLAGIFGVNPAVEEFTNKYNVSFDLTNEWSSSFLITKP